MLSIIYDIERIFAYNLEIKIEQWINVQGKII